MATRFPGVLSANVLGPCSLEEHEQPLVPFVGVSGLLKLLSASVVRENDRKGLLAPAVSRSTNES